MSLCIDMEETKVPNGTHTMEPTDLYQKKVGFRHSLKFTLPFQKLLLKTLMATQSHTHTLAKPELPVL